MRWLIPILILFSMGNTSKDDGIPDRKPDIVSVPADISDYYTYDAGNWVWSEDYDKAKSDAKAILRKQAARQEVKLQVEKPKAPTEAKNGEEDKPEIKLEICLPGEDHTVFYCIQ